MSHHFLNPKLDVLHLNQNLDFSIIYDILITVRGRENPKDRIKEKVTPQTRTAFIMKKFSLQSLVSFIDSIDAPQDIKDIRNEIVAELNKGAEKAQANRDLYEQAKGIVLKALSDTPATIAEIYAEVENELPEGFSKGKVQYAITRLWADEVVKHEGKTNTYTKKA